jgi:hypothetical protein
MGGRVDGSNGGQHPILCPEPPSHEGTKTDDPVVNLRDEHERSPERIIQVLPSEELGRPTADGTGAQGSTEKLQHRLLVIFAIGAKEDSGSCRAARHDSNSS